MKNDLLVWWFTPKLPRVHWPKTVLDYKRWLFHPLKRRLAKYYLWTLKRVFGLKTVAITGSCGKTTTKEMLLAILSQEGKVVATFENIDPVYNIPTTILKCPPTAKYLILEMSVEYPGEIDFYFWLGKPDVAIVTNIYPTHTEFFGSVKGVFDEKKKIVKFLKSNAQAILNHANAYTKKMAKITSAKIFWFNDRDITSKNIKITKDYTTTFDLLIDSKKIRVTIPVAGHQFVEDALAAVACARVLGLNLEDIKYGLENFDVPKHRMRVFKHKSGVLIVDESYNNNPVAARNALITFAEIAKEKKRGVVFGDMLELGKLEESSHRALGREVSNLKPNFVIGVGPASKFLLDEIKKSGSSAKLFWLKDQSEVLKSLRPFLKKDYAILIKGSRSIGLDKVISKLR